MDQGWTKTNMDRTDGRTSGWTDGCCLHGVSGRTDERRTLEGVRSRGGGNGMQGEAGNAAPCGHALERVFQP
eukprot:5553406-Pyramimonas_sp.AAC.1